MTPSRDTGPCHMDVAASHVALGEIRSGWASTSGGVSLLIASARTSRALDRPPHATVVRYSVSAP
jgi:sugar (pentulose or hexulose) kinase